MSKMNPEDLKRRLEVIEATCLEIHASLRALMEGRKVRIVSKYNGQDYGSSQKPLTGKVFTISHAGFDERGPWFFLKGPARSAVRIKDIEILEDEK